ncbi:MAG: hypothetical protein GEU74_13325 [Nitriliruptorales bacterium]|nr:hypothetical protein [Nitriliruptorales bacterium]
MPTRLPVYLEAGAKRVFAVAPRWPGWCRSAKTEDAALESLLAYLPRYAAALGTAVDRPPTVRDVSEFDIVQRVAGNATTDFGAPARPVAGDEAGFRAAEARRQLGILQICWVTFDRAAAAAHGAELRKGPRGGGRDVDAIVAHVLDADAAYLSKLGGKLRRDSAAAVDERMQAVRDAIVDTAAARVRGEAPPRQPRSGSLWPVPYLVRRSAWHALDHAWEIEDRRLD